MRRLEKDTPALLAKEFWTSSFVCHKCGCAFDMPRRLVLSIIVCPDCKQSASRVGALTADYFETNEGWALEIARVRAKIANLKE